MLRSAPTSSRGYGGVELLKLGDDIGKKLKALRRAARLSQEEVAEKLNTTKNTISNWETNKTEITVTHYLKYEKLAREQIERENYTNMKSRIFSFKGAK